jgi:hypothetical protein
LPREGEFKMCLSEIFDVAHAYVSGDINTTFGKLAKGFWDVFSSVNGNPESGNYGVRFALMLFFAVFLISVLQLRTKIIYDKKHIVAFVGSLFLIFRIVTMMGFEWGWQIDLYDDWVLHFLSPPLEHFWNLLFYGCIGYYTLNIYDYYPGILKKILWAIPVSICAFFVYSSITWKIFFLSHLPEISQYTQCSADWQNHFIVSVLSFYIFIIAIKKYKKYHCFLSAFWTLVFIEHFLQFVFYYNGYEAAELTTIFHAISIWSLPLLILHFINAYIIRSEIPRERRGLDRNGNRFVRCDDCLKLKEEI